MRLVPPRLHHDPLNPHSLDETPPCPPPRLWVAAPDTKTSAALLGKCTDDDRAAAGRFNGERRRLQFLYGRALARALLPPGDWRITPDSHGRPKVQALDGRPGPDISISHSQGWIAAAMTERGRIGIDLETPRLGRDNQAMAEAFFSPAECNAVAAEGERALLAFWTMREAVAKLSGEGLAAALAQDGTMLISGRNSICFGQGKDLPWVLAHRDLGAYHLAVAWAPDPLPPDTAQILMRAMDQGRDEDLTSQK